MTTTTETTVTPDEAQRVALTIKQQITLGVWMSLGAHEPGFIREQRGGLTFKARLIVPGQTRVRIMRVTIVLTGRDTYDIEVGYMKARTFEWVTRFEATDVYADSLARTLLALDDVL
jgi:hypothetical protein